MTIRRRILLLIAATGIIVLATAAIALTALSQAGRFAERIEGLQRRLEVVAAINGGANHYGQVAAVLLAGRDDLSELQGARLALERSFARLSQVTKTEIERLAGAGGVEDELRGLENSRRMTDLYHAVDRSVARALVLIRDGNSVEAIEIFRTEVAFRLSNEMQPLIDAELADDRSGVALQLAGIAGLRQTAGLAAGGLAVVGLGACLWLGSGIARATRRQAEDAAAREASGAAAMAEAAAQLGSGESRHTQFLADVSHELRTPLTILRGEADVALRGEAGATELRLALERIQGQAEELGELLEDMIGFARADADDEQFAPSRVRLADVAKAAVEDGNVLAEPREVTITATLRDDGAWIEADQRRLRRALMIGIDNAVKHTPPGGNVTLATATSSGEVEIKILDDGPGVPADEQPHVFERFFRGRAENELQNRGIGIGLPIAREIIEQHRGRIELDNRAAGGAVLRIVLPRAEDASP